MQPIVVIQNTEYHFETAISLYSMLDKLKRNVYFYRTPVLQNRYKQLEFLANYKVRMVTDNIITDNNTIGMIVSVYPNPYVNKNEAIPNYNNDKIFSIISQERLLYVSHRFKNIDDYEDNINQNNSLCLSPLSNKIGLDNLYLAHTLMEPDVSFHDSIIRLTFQGHFSLGGKDLILLKTMISCLSKIDITKHIMINIVGTNLQHTINALQPINLPPNTQIKFCNAVDEDIFYHILNHETDFIVPLLTPELNNSTYILERYSTNFNLALSLHKPIFCHEIFKEIYKIPGIYFNSTDIESRLQQTINISQKEYVKLIQSFDIIVSLFQNHNQQIIEKKIFYLLNK